jgi:hypothetical protein
MPLTDLQKDVLGVLAANRSEESHFAGSVILHVDPSSPRFSKDFDIFHEAAEQVCRASEQDLESLRSRGFEVQPLERSDEWHRETTFRRARVTRGADTLDLDWAADSAFRFFPIERDPLLGWRLHRFDIATNKALALSARSETRDYVDIVSLTEIYPLAAICWAACGKDPGFNPASLLMMMRRFAKLDPRELGRIQSRMLDPVALKEAWIRASDEASAKMEAIAEAQPKLPIGVAFVDANGHPGWIGDDPSLRIHAPSVRGCWPTIRGLDL